MAGVELVPVSVVDERSREDRERTEIQLPVHEIALRLNIGFRFHANRFWHIPPRDTPSQKECSVFALD
ncbi:hypothetical protein GCM10010403_04190 [Glycomyces rutgersensis]|uniref:Uncharacterized protein n=1 Tax=Glycomyces rutgersensis TaxID=58115 RepID=A0ABN3F6G7_9ACTN